MKSTCTYTCYNKQRLETSLPFHKGSGAHQRDADDHLPGLWSCGESQCHCSAGWHSGVLDPRGVEGHHQSLRYWSAWLFRWFAIHSGRARVQGGRGGWSRCSDAGVVGVDGREEENPSARAFVGLLQLHLSYATLDPWNDRVSQTNADPEG